MILRGAPIHRDGHGECGLLSPPFHHGLIPFIASPLAQQSRQPHAAFRQPSVPVRHAAVSHRLVTRLAKERTRMCVMRESALCHGWIGE